MTKPSKPSAKPAASKTGAKVAPKAAKPLPAPTPPRMTLRDHNASDRSKLRVDIAKHLMGQCLAQVDDLDVDKAAPMIGVDATEYTNADHAFHVAAALALRGADALILAMDQLPEPNPKANDYEPAVRHPDGHFPEDDEDGKDDGDTGGKTSTKPAPKGGKS